MVRNEIAAIIITAFIIVVLALSGATIFVLAL